MANDGPLPRFVSMFVAALVILSSCGLIGSDDDEAGEAAVNPSADEADSLGQAGGDDTATGAGGLLDPVDVAGSSDTSAPDDDPPPTTAVPPSSVATAAPPVVALPAPVAEVVDAEGDACVALQQVYRIGGLVFDPQYTQDAPSTLVNLRKLADSTAQLVGIVAPADDGSENAQELQGVRDELNSGATRVSTFIEVRDLMIDVLTRSGTAIDAVFLDAADTCPEFASIPPSPSDTFVAALETDFPD